MIYSVSSFDHNKSWFSEGSVEVVSIDPGHPGTGPGQHKKLEKVIDLLIVTPHLEWSEGMRGNSYQLISSLAT